ncbi:MAG: alanine racemase [Oscillospiraceae bacterium]|nr:alanine racemase [Oscillospiraceae bacterium]
MQWETQRTWAHISLSALEHNYRALRAGLDEGCRFLGVVKTNAYGHGALPVARRLQELGCEMLAVATLDEGVELRRADITAPILIFGATPACFASQVVEYGLTQTVFTPELAQALSEAAVASGTTAHIHIKLDTGMSRVGILAHDPQAAAREAAALCVLPGLEAEGIFTHFANADADEAYTMLQFTRFMDTVGLLEEKYGIKFAIRHCAASAATINYPCTHLDMVRPGIALYGHYPDASCQGLVEDGLMPVMRLHTRVCAVHELPAGTPVSYGCTAVVQRNSRLAVLPIGYADGLARSLSNRFCVDFDGQSAPIVGRVCMDMCMVDVTDLPQVQPGSVATVFGTDQPLEQAAQLLDTISYELLCRISPRVPRVYPD